MPLPRDRPPTLADVAACTPWLDLVCSRCERRGHLSVARLVAEHGADTAVRAVLDALAADCPKRRPNQHVYDLCGAHCPTLTRLSAEPARAVEVASGRRRVWER